MIRVTPAAFPGRGRVLAAKAAGLAGAAVAVPLGERPARAHGVHLFPASALTRVRVEVGTAVLPAAAAVLAPAVGTLVRRGPGAVSAVVVGLVVPHLLVAQVPFLPAGAAAWLTRATPAAALAGAAVTLRRRDA